MAHTILVPTDLRVASLNTLKLALDFIEESNVRVVLMYAEYLDSSITDLLFYSRKSRVSNTVTDEFKEALEILRNRFEGKLLGNIVIERFHGYNSNALSNFVEAHKADSVFLPKSYQLVTSSKSFNPIPLISELKLPINYMDWQSNSGNITEREQLTALFT